MPITRSVGAVVALVLSFSVYAQNIPGPAKDPQLAKAYQKCEASGHQLLAVAVVDKNGKVTDTSRVTKGPYKPGVYADNCQAIGQASQAENLAALTGGSFTPPPSLSATITKVLAE